MAANYTITLADADGRTYELEAESGSEVRETLLCELEVSAEESSTEERRQFFVAALEHATDAGYAELVSGLYADRGHGLRVDVRVRRARPSAVHRALGRIGRRRSVRALGAEDHRAFALAAAEGAARGGERTLEVAWCRLAVCELEMLRTVLRQRGVDPELESEVAYRRGPDERRRERARRARRNGSAPRGPMAEALRRAGITPSAPHGATDPVGRLGAA